MSNTPKFLGEGSYGCIHYPRILCENEDLQHNDDKISKIMMTENAEKEFKETEIIDAIDPDNIYHLPKPIICSPNIQNTTTQNAINLCKILKSKNIKNYKLLVMENGGVDLTVLQKIVNKIPKTESIKIMENFWKESTKIMDGLELFEKRNVIHHDLKGENIVYDVQKNKINFIDFGLMQTKHYLKEKCINNKNKLGELHWSFPPETQFLNQIIFLKLKKLNANSQQIFLQEYFSKTNINLLHFISVISKNTNQMTVNSISSLLFKQLKQFLQQVNENNYNYFLEKSISTIDIFGVGMCMFQLLNGTRQYISPQFYDELSELFLHMINFNVFDRIHPFHANIYFKNIIAKYIHIVPPIQPSPILVIDHIGKTKTPSLKSEPSISKSLLNENPPSNFSFPKTNKFKSFPILRTFNKKFVSKKKTQTKRKLSQSKSFSHSHSQSKKTKILRRNPDF
jgi:serine/threonine protein kinase